MRFEFSTADVRLLESILGSLDVAMTMIEDTDDTPEGRKMVASIEQEQKMLAQKLNDYALHVVSEMFWFSEMRERGLVE